MGEQSIEYIIYRSLSGGSLSSEEEAALLYWLSDNAANWEFYYTLKGSLLLVEFPSEHLWSRIEVALRQDKPKKTSWIRRLFNFVIKSQKI